MAELVLLLFKINLVLLLFAAVYHLVLRRLTFYTLNRIFLVGGILFSTVYPFINLTDFFHRQQQVNPRVTALVPTIDVKVLINNYSIIDYWQITVLLFFAGVAFMSTRLIAQFISLYHVHKSSKPGNVGNLTVRILKGPLSPFSFWQTIYINPALHSDNELNTILAHERIHVKEWHTLDIILAEISVVFYWFNPGVWLMKRAIKENIEFITDARIVRRGINKKAYQYSLLGVGNLQATASLVNHFNLSDLKKRIKMMNAKRSSPKKLLIYALILPVMLITTLAFTISKKQVERHLMPLTDAITQVSPFNKLDHKTEVISPKPKIKRKVSANPVLADKRDSVRNVRYVMSKVVLKGDSLDVNQGLTDEMLAKIDQLKERLHGKVKAINLSSTTISYMDSLGIRRTGFPSPNSKATIVVSGYSPPKHRDSLNLINVRYIVNGKVITEEDLKKINGDDLRTIIVKKSDKDLSEIIITAKKN